MAVLNRVNSQDFKKSQIIKKFKSNYHFKMTNLLQTQILDLKPSNEILNFSKLPEAVALSILDHIWIF